MTFADRIRDLEADRFEITTGDVWCQATPRERRVDERSEGWKLHLSCSVLDAEKMLDAALPVLRDARVMFKAATDAVVLAGINDGQGGISQAGKFITVYPRDDTEAVELAQRLDEQTQGHRGPWIPSDRPLYAESRVHYRYGSFVAPTVVQADGEIATMLESPDGPVSDVRGDTYRAPSWVTDPFLQAGVARPIASPDLVLDGRWVIVDTLHRSPRGAVQLAIDVETEEAVILKRAHRWASVAGDGRDAVDRLRAEADVLSCVADHRGFPRIGALIEDRTDLLLVMEDLAREGLDVELEEHRRTGLPIGIDRAFDLIEALSDTLARLHVEGIIHRDTKPGNIRWRADGTLVLIDHEMAGPPGPIDTAGFRGTRGYVAPERLSDRPGTLSDDVYSIGVILHELLTLDRPPFAPDPWDLSTRRAERLRPDLEPAAIQLRDRLVGPEESRPSDAAAALDLIRRERPRVASVAGPSAGPGALPRLEREEARAYAGDVVALLAQTSGDGFAGKSPGLFYGAAGQILALSVATRVGIDGADAALADRVQRRERLPLSAAPFTAGSLYTGEVGIAVALAHAAHALDRRDLAAESAEFAAAGARHRLENPDVLAGAAGRLLGHLLLEELGIPGDHLEAARAAGNHLVATAVREGSDEVAGDAIGWVLPEVGGGLSHRGFRGYAHGSAGIADALLALYERGDGRGYRAVAVEAIESLVATQERDEMGGSGWFERHRPLSGQGLRWCYGAPGVALALARAGAHGLGDDDTLERAVTSTRRATFLGPDRCHGLAASAGILLDVDVADDAARHHGALLADFIQDRDGTAAAEQGGGPIPPGLMTGLAGMLVAMCRLADPSVPDPLWPTPHHR